MDILADDLRAKVFEDRATPGNWRVEKMDADGGYKELQVFTGPDARQRAIAHAEQRYGECDVITLPPYRST